MLISLILLSFRDDGERIAVVDDSGKAVLAIEPNMQASYFICLPESRMDEVPTVIDIRRDSQTQQKEVLGPRPIDLPPQFAKKAKVEQRQQCAVSELIKIENDGLNKTEITAPNGALVVAAVSSNRHILIYIGLFIIFMIGLFGAFYINSQKKWTFRPSFRRYDFAVVFILSLMSAYGIAMAVTALTPKTDFLFPSFGELFGLMICNFVGFLAATGAWSWFRNKKNSSLKSSETSDAENEENVTPFAPWTAIAVGFSLAVTAAVLVSFAPLPGLSTIEMASQLPSTCFMSGFFAILAGISEECLFRGVIQTSLEARHDSKHPILQNAVAIGVATLLFTSLHVEQSIDHLWALIPITCVSIISGLLKIRYKSLYPSMLLHMTYNAALLLPSLLIYMQFVT